MAWLHLFGLLLVWKRVERDTYKCMAWLPLLGLLLVWTKVERDTYKYMSWFLLLSFYIGLEKGGERHIQMYGMITLTWFIIDLDMFPHGLLLQWVSTVKTQIRVLV
jgi:hypothetical protein